MLLFKISFRTRATLALAVFQLAIVFVYAYINDSLQILSFGDLISCVVVIYTKTILKMCTTKCPVYSLAVSALTERVQKIFTRSIYLALLSL